MWYDVVLCVAVRCVSWCRATMCRVGVLCRLVTYAVIYVVVMCRYAFMWNAWWCAVAWLCCMVVGVLCCIVSWRDVSLCDMSWCNVLCNVVRWYGVSSCCGLCCVTLCCGALLCSVVMWVVIWWCALYCSVVLRYSTQRRVTGVCIVSLWFVLYRDVWCYCASLNDVLCCDMSCRYACCRPMIYYAVIYCCRVYVVLLLYVVVYCCVLPVLCLIALCCILCCLMRCCVVWWYPLIYILWYAVIYRDIYWRAMLLYVACCNMPWHAVSLCVACMYGVSCYVVI